ncbi:MAG TPA: bifunctional diaminohydroxyphosphoribosylaminopyrimidine deaminase/5-amino-6-(5-phosphoribosylamino)uracil reductase RibD [Gammaproteobacteria bacterium]|nr:bifunctional diaminohydroxyphosphoribosylaminopyrimidine deaminase/5-amino-6-(5-phosphoribosylamino)uracil reductase RibD [Gammaproteobacteria bacterium]
MNDQDYLRLALNLAQKWRGFCAPNPSVGAIIVKNGQVVSEGEHLGPGHPHAEVVALNQVEKDIEDATLYVTLEPCCHWGKTPPCTERIVQSGIREVVYGFRDPNPKVNGLGEQTLKELGVECRYVQLDEIDEFYESYAWWSTNKKPWVTAKLAISLDGKIAGKNGEPISITGQELKQFTHEWRKRSDAILTTAKTIINDDPAFNARLYGEVIPKSVYIIDKNLEIPVSAQIFQTAKDVMVFQNETLAEMLEKIAEDGVHDLWVEAGGQLFTSLLTENLVQRAFVYVAPKVIGNGGVEGFIAENNVFRNAKDIRWENYGADVVCEMRWV